MSDAFWFLATSKLVALYSLDSNAISHKSIIVIEFSLRFYAIS